MPTNTTGDARSASSRAPALNAALALPRSRTADLTNAATSGEYHDRQFHRVTMSCDKMLVLVDVFVQPDDDQWITVLGTLDTST